ncbi:hypothetical protein DFP72DRAFT_856576 [Ephemerocybe angulata]|uniref:Uncharacterized protein n=1 Tax=Ephemerocybe angulata TaxID=980116 RepID=A0A8H6HFI4_9AGAR|nr:hypothetical protein DFP72DRAFT_856576 [Tulosesus angulatus]
MVPSQNPARRNHFCCVGANTPAHNLQAPQKHRRYRSADSILLRRRNRTSPRQHHLQDTARRIQFCCVGAIARRHVNTTSARWALDPQDFHPPFLRTLELTHWHLNVARRIHFCCYFAISGHWEGRLYKRSNSDRRVALRIHFCCGFVITSTTASKYDTPQAPQLPQQSPTGVVYHPVREWTQPHPSLAGRISMAVIIPAKSFSARPVSRQLTFSDSRIMHSPFDIPVSRGVYSRRYTNIHRFELRQVQQHAPRRTSFWYDHSRYRLFGVLTEPCLPQIYLENDRGLEHSFRDRDLFQATSSPPSGVREFAPILHGLLGHRYSTPSISAHSIPNSKYYSVGRGHSRLDIGIAISISVSCERSAVVPNGAGLDFARLQAQWLTFRFINIFGIRHKLYRKAGMLNFRGIKRPWASIVVLDFSVEFWFTGMTELCWDSPGIVKAAVSNTEFTAKRTPWPVQAGLDSLDSLFKLDSKVSHTKYIDCRIPFDSCRKCVNEERRFKFNDALNGSKFAYEDVWFGEMRHAPDPQFSLSNPTHLGERTRVVSIRSPSLSSRTSGHFTFRRDEGSGRFLPCTVHFAISHSVSLSFHLYPHALSFLPPHSFLPFAPLLSLARPRCTVLVVDDDDDVCRQYPKPRSAFVSRARSPQSQYFEKRASIPPPPTLHPPIVRHHEHWKPPIAVVIVVDLGSHRKAGYDLYSFIIDALYHSLLHFVEGHGGRAAFRLAEGRLDLGVCERIPSSLCSAILTCRCRCAVGHHIGSLVRGVRAGRREKWNILRYSAVGKPTSSRLSDWRVRRGVRLTRRFVCVETDSQFHSACARIPEDSMAWVLLRFSVGLAALWTLLQGLGSGTSECLSYGVCLCFKFTCEANAVSVCTKLALVFTYIFAILTYAALQ